VLPYYTPNGLHFVSPVSPSACNMRKGRFFQCLWWGGTKVLLPGDARALCPRYRVPKQIQGFHNSCGKLRGRRACRDLYGVPPPNLTLSS
jgi:hypothetical protein